MTEAWLDEVAWDSEGLVPAIAQDATSGRVLMLAWMDRAALAATVASGEAVYYSRSRRKLWRKGEQSGHMQNVREVRIDCDGDVVMLAVEQVRRDCLPHGACALFFSPARKRSLDRDRAGIEGPGANLQMKRHNRTRTTSCTVSPRPSTRARAADAETSYVARLLARGRKTRC